MLRGPFWHGPRRFAIALAAAFVVAGCNPAAFPTVRLEGRVTIDGQPVEKGQINFASSQQGGGPSATAQIVAGRYVADRVPQGKVRVYFDATRQTGKTVEHYGQQWPEIVNIVPQKYRGGIEIEVAGKTATYDFDLQSK